MILSLLALGAATPSAMLRIHVHEEPTIKPPTVNLPTLLECREGQIGLEAVDLSSLYSESGSVGLLLSHEYIQRVVAPVQAGTRVS